MEQLQHLDDATFIPTLEQAAVDYAATHTRPQLAAWLKRRILTTEPGAAERRRQQALADRRVAHYPGPDGTAHLWAQLDAADAAAIWHTINAHAHHTTPNSSTPDSRTMDQRRADAMVELILGGGSQPTRAPQTEILVTVSAETLAGTSEQPGELAGYGPITAAHARELAQGDSRWRKVLFDRSSGQLLSLDQAPGNCPTEQHYRPSATLTRTIKARDTTCRFPGSRRSAQHTGIDIDHVNPWPHGPTHADNLIALCRSHHYLKTHAGWKIHQDPGAIVHWTTPTGHTFTTHPTDHRPTAPATRQRPDTRGDPPF